MDTQLENLKGNRGIHIGHINIRSLFPKIDLFRQTILNSGLAVCRVSETWMNEMLPDKFVSVEGYKLMRHDRRWSTGNNNKRKKGGGVGIFIKNNLTCSAHELDRLNISTKDVEGQWIVLSPTFQKKIVIGNLYRPPAGNFEAFCDYLDSCLTQVKTYRNTEIVIMGDMNVNYLDNGCPKTKQIKTWARLAGMTQLIDKPTRTHQNKASCLDLIFSDSQDISSSGVANVNISDHDLIYITKSKIKKPKSKTTFMGRSYKNFNENRFRELLLSIDWTGFDNANDVDRAWQTILDNIKQITDTMCPLKEFKVNKLKEAWITNELLELIKDKDRALSWAKRTGREEDWSTARSLRNNAIKALRKAKSDFV